MARRHYARQPGRQPAGLRGQAHAPQRAGSGSAAGCARPAAGERRKPLAIIQTARLISQTAAGTAGSEPARDKPGDLRR